MKKLYIFTFVFIFNLFSQMIDAEENIFGTGARSCGEMIADDLSPYDDYHLVGWISGYISAINTEFGTTKGVNNSFESIYYAVKKRCEEEPLDIIAEAVQHVYMYKL